VPAPYACESDLQCVKAGEFGRCENVGYCSYDDDACPSHRRWGPYAAESLADACLDDAASSGSGTGSGTGSSMDGGGSGGGSGDTTTTATPSDCDSWPDGATHGRPLSWTGFGPVQDFPILVVLTPERIDYAATAPLGADLHFIDEAGVELPFEVATWNPGGESFVWVKLPEVTPAPGQVQMHYGGSATHTTVEGTAVWAAGFRGAWHFDDAFTSAKADGYDVAAVAVPFEPGQVGAAIRIAATGQATVGSGFEDMFASAGTASAWVRIDVTFGQLAGAILDRGSSGLGDDGFALSVQRTSDNGVLEFRRQFTDNISWETPPLAVSPQTWHHVAAVMTSDGGAPRVDIYVDGVNAGATTSDRPPFGPPFDDPTVPELAIGGDAGGGSPLLGLVDELRLSDIARDAAWIDAEFRSGRDELLTYGDETRCP
jgi:hypothetical protein